MATAQNKRKITKKQEKEQEKPVIKEEESAHSDSVVNSENQSSDNCTEEPMEYSGDQLENAVKDLEEVEISESESEVSEEEVSENIVSSASETLEVTGSGSQEEEEDNNDDTLRTVFIKDLDYDLKEDTLREQMERLGEIVIVTIPLTHDQRRNKGFAYVEFKDVTTASKALQLNGTELLGRKIFVAQAKPKENKKIFTVFAKNLSYNTTKEDLTTHFEKFGKVYNVSLPVDSENPERNKGFCFIEYTDESVIPSVMRAKHLIHGRTLYLNEGDKNEDRNVKRSNDRLYGRKDNMGGSNDRRGGRDNDRNNKRDFSERRGGRDNNRNNGREFSERRGGRDNDRGNRRDFNDSNDRRGNRNGENRFSKGRNDRNDSKSDRFEKFNSRRDGGDKKDFKKGNKKVFDNDSG